MLCQTINEERFWASPRQGLQVRILSLVEFWDNFPYGITWILRGDREDQPIDLRSEAIADLHNVFTLR